MPSRSWTSWASTEVFARHLELPHCHCHPLTWRRSWLFCPCMQHWCMSRGRRRCTSRPALCCWRLACPATQSSETRASGCHAGDIKKAKDAGFHTCQALLMNTRKVRPGREFEMMLYGAHVYKCSVSIPSRFPCNLRAACREIHMLHTSTLAEPEIRDQIRRHLHIKVVILVAYTPRYRPRPPSTTPGIAALRKHEDTLSHSRHESAAMFRRFCARSRGCRRRRSRRCWRRPIRWCPTWAGSQRAHMTSWCVIHTPYLSLSLRAASGTSSMCCSCAEPRAACLEMLPTPVLWVVCSTCSASGNYSRQPSPGCSVAEAVEGDRQDIDGLRGFERAAWRWDRVQVHHRDVWRVPVRTPCVI